MQRAFTLIEVLAASFLVVLGAGGVFALVQQTVTFTTNAVFQLEATYLAQEGIEITRNIRDTNLLKIHKGLGGDWTDNLTGCTTGCEADYTQAALVSYTDSVLKLSSGLYNYTVGTNTLFKRKITVTQPSAEVLEVLVQVTWVERTRSHDVTIATELYNWLPAP
ncbi:hypothetical protein IH982_02070 [Patescibacteria group bacterium]|nr:hypothetical protein [Patescibacteria group bacterium]